MGVKVKSAIIITLLLGIVIAGCSKKPNSPSFDIDSISSYSEIPGVTDDEITAIEALKSERHSFSFGTMYSTEAFILSDGRYSGFLTRFCDLLSGLFGIPFIQEFHLWDSLKGGIDNNIIDFIGELTPTPERKQTYFMSLPIAERPLGVFTMGNTSAIESATDLNGLKIGFYEDTITPASVFKAYPSLVFNLIYYKNNQDAARALEAGEIDAFICDATESHFFSGNTLFRSKGILPLVYTSVSLAAKKPELEPVISVMNKYIISGGIDKLHELYRESNHEYVRYEFNLFLTDEEKVYLSSLNSAGFSVPVALAPDDYPICFFNEAEAKFQGIAPDIIAELSDLTGIEFNVVTDKDTSNETILNKLKAGEVAIVSDLQYLADRKEDFLWSEPYSTSHFALLSKADFPYLEIYQVVRSTVGVIRGSAYEELYNLWFHDSINVKYYNNQKEALDALEKDEIKLLLASERTLLYLANYLEKPGYKANIFLREPLEETFFGFNKNEKILWSIIRKAQKYINTEKIIINWTSRIFDYSHKIAYQRLFYLSVSSVALSFLLLIMGLLLFFNIRTRKLYKKQMVTLSTIYKSLPDMVYSKDINGKFTSCNKSFEEFTQTRDFNIIGKTALDIYPGDVIMAQEFHEIDQKVMDNNTTLKIERWYVLPDNSQRLLETVKAPLIQDGKVIGLLNIARDITEHKKAEAAANEASKAKSDFLAKMSHEIRTPMNAIIGMTELALRSAELYDAQKHILTVKQASAHLLSIINDILDFSKIEKGKMEIISGDYSLSVLINNVISIIRMRLIDSDIRFVVNIDSNIPNILIGDETRIRQVMLNILSNAVKYTDKGFVSFSVNREIIDENNIYLVFEVLDSGKGIKKENIKKLFGEYIQLDPINKSIDGVGLGLAITWNIVKEMNGNIEVSSEYGKGSSFVVTIPQKIKSLEPMAFVEKAENLNVIIYERRELYAYSIISAIDNLGVKNTLVNNDLELSKKLSNDVYNFVFISNSLLEKNYEIILEYGKSAKIVVLAEFGEAIPERKLSIIAMPVYSISIANILNGISDSFNYSESDDQIVRFIAPDVKILIVDDIKTNLKVAEGLMVPYQMQIDVCQSGKEAIESIKRKKYDVIFMDHKMPDMDGVKTTNKIRSITDESNYYKNLPIIALTANAISGTKEMFLENGFSDFLSKPIDIIELDTILDKWIPDEMKKKHLGLRNNNSKKNFNEKLIEINGVDVKRGIYLSG